VSARIGTVRVRQLEKEPGQPWQWRLPDDVIVARGMGKTRRG
jgi:hypothetical protein